MPKLTGSCNCESVHYEVNGDIKSIVNCHCCLCRKMNGSVFSTYVVVLEQEFELLNGNLNTYEISDKSTKSICADCGTPIFNSNPEYAGLRMLHLGSVDDALGLTPKLNIYCESQVDWTNSISNLTSIDKGPQ